MRVWIDLSNSPHPLLFEPVVTRLRASGHEVLLTARDHAQTLELTHARWPEADVIGRPSPPGLAAKGRTLTRRVRNLTGWAVRRRPHVAVSHNSYAQIVAARAAGIRVVTAMDYEHQPANHLAFRLAHRILLPVALPSLQRAGARDGKVVRYDGYKEELYLGGFRPDENIYERLGLVRDGVIVAVARTPPAGATYHRAENDLFDAAVQALADRDEVRVVLLPRGASDRARWLEEGHPRIVVPAHAVDSRSLMYGADVVLGGGGTMTREAALLGTPTFSVFAGAPAAVDDSLLRAGRLRRLERLDDLATVGRRSAPPAALDALKARADGLLDLFAATVSETAASSRRAG